MVETVYDAHQVGLEGECADKRQQTGLLLGPDVGDTAVGLVGVDAAGGRRRPPAARTPNGRACPRP